MKKGSKMSEAHKRKISAAHKGKKLSEEHKRKISDTLKGKPSPKKGKKTGKPSPNKGKTHTEASKRKMSDANKGKTITAETRKKISAAFKDKPLSEEHKKRISAGHQNKSYDEWEAYACEKKYCPKFNEACKESNRAKYGRRCFICNKTEKENGQKLSVHHVDMNKAQGCESNWKLVPLCKHHHATAHNDELIARLGYLIRGE